MPVHILGVLVHQLPGEGSWHLHSCVIHTPNVDSHVQRKCPAELRSLRVQVQRRTPDYFL